MNRDSFIYFPVWMSFFLLKTPVLLEFELCLKVCATLWLAYFTENTVWCHFVVYTHLFCHCFTIFQYINLYCMLRLFPVSGYQFWSSCECSSPCLKKICLFVFGCAGSLLLCAGFLWLQWAGTTSGCSVWSSYHRGFFFCRARALGHAVFKWQLMALEWWLSSCEAWT